MQISQNIGEVVEAKLWLNAQGHLFSFHSEDVFNTKITIFAPLISKAGQDQ